MPSRAKYLADWKSRNPEKVKAYSKAYNEKYYEQNRVKCRNRIMRRRIREQSNITLEEYNEMLSKASGRCEVCGKKAKRLVLDHCHKQNLAPAFVCDFCNHLIGVVETPGFNKLIPKIHKYIELFEKGQDI